MCAGRNSTNMLFPADHTVTRSIPFAVGALGTVCLIRYEAHSHHCTAMVGTGKHVNTIHQIVKDAAVMGTKSNFFLNDTTK